MEERLPFELKRTRHGTFRASWPEEKVDVDVAGGDDRPDPALLTTLCGVVARWPEVKRAIASFVAALPPDARIDLEESTWAFAARDCGLDGELYFQHIGLMKRETPGRVEVSFYTGLPDGYANYTVAIENGLPVAITAFVS